ncbi:MAG: deoxynucleoside kinase [Calditrichaeota bacterium]|nr:deoxynucleoside kinase [Calditrichota bacterium]
MSLPSGSIISIEGGIGVGKTSLARILAEELDAELILEEPAANPFLMDFYRDPRRWGLQTQITFLLSRHRQMADLRQRSLFNRTIIADYLFDKDRIFAALNLEDREFALYQNLAEALAGDIPEPDLVVYLQAPPERLLTNIRIRDLEYERSLNIDYLQSLCETYNRFFIHWDRSPLLIVNAARIDFVKNETHRARLIAAVREARAGTVYVNPEE